MPLCSYIYQGVHVFVCGHICMTCQCACVCVCVCVCVWFYHASLVLSQIWKPHSVFFLIDLLWFIADLFMVYCWIIQDGLISPHLFIWFAEPSPSHLLLFAVPWHSAKEEASSLSLHLFFLCTHWRRLVSDVILKFLISARVFCYVWFADCLNIVLLKSAND